MIVFISDPCSKKAISYLQQKGLRVVYQPQISPDKLLVKVNQADALMVRSRTKVTKEIIEKGKNLKIVARIGSGYDNIDVEACRKKDIVVVNAPEANSQAVAELTFALIISFLRQIPYALSSMKEGLWVKNNLWGKELCGKTIGILGHGSVGKRVESLSIAFGARPLVFSRSYRTASLEEIFRKADIITIHLALNSQTKNLITKKFLDRMKKEAILVNIARGEIVNEEDLYQVLRKKKIAGAILDTFWQEPLPADSRWRKLDNVLLTPHIGAATYEALEKASMAVAEDIVRFFKGESPLNAIK